MNRVRHYQFYIILLLTTILRSIPQFPAILCQIHDDRLNNNDAHAVSTFTKNHTVQEAAAVIQANMLEVKCSCYFHQNTDSSSSNFHSLLNAHKNIVSDKRKKRPDNSYIFVN